MIIVMEWSELCYDSVDRATGVEVGTEQSSYTCIGHTHPAASILDSYHVRHTTENCADESDVTA